MKSITVSASKKYEVLIDKGLLSNLSDHLRPITKASKLAIISDSNVWPLYGNAIIHNLISNGFEYCNYVFPAGEESKNGHTYLEVLNFLAENQITRSDAIIALGGGVVGDLSGFAAATYLRGVAYIQIPTTLLAMVDSSVGGKTAIDLPAGKNLAGAFCQPNIVLCDLNTLNTLPHQNFIDGCAEVIKYGVLYDCNLFVHLTEHGIDFDREYVVTRCVELKRDVICEDEFDTGARQKLNLGHTIGHAVERNSNFSVTHGQAVAIGMCIVAKSATKAGICTVNVLDSIQNILSAFGLPTTTDQTVDALYGTALSDKKRTGGNVNLILPRSIGDCIISPIPVSTLKSFIEAGL